MHVDGGCHCGYITYEAEIDPGPGKGCLQMGGGPVKKCSQDAALLLSTRAAKSKAS